MGKISKTTVWGLVFWLTVFLGGAAHAEKSHFFSRLLFGHDVESSESKLLPQVTQLLTQPEVHLH